MRIDIEFRVYPRYLQEDTEEEVVAVFENVPYIPNAWAGLSVKWEDFYSEEKAEMIYDSIETQSLTPNKTMEVFEKDRILVLYEFMPYKDDIDYDNEEYIEDFPSWN